MGFESLLFIVVVVEAVWIISSLFRGSDDERKAQQRRQLGRPGEPPNRARPQTTNVDRFLEEINRRRREAERQAGIPRQEPGNRPRPAPTRPEQPPRRQPGSAAVIVTAQPVPTAQRPAQAATTAKPRLRQEPLEVELDSPPPKAAPVSSAPAEQPYVPSTTTRDVAPARRVTSATSTKARSPSPVLEQVLPLLRDRRALPTAFVLNEILGPPLSRRRPRVPGKVL